MPGPVSVGDLAKRRVISLAGSEVQRTPLLIPSFSSKGFPDVKKTVEYCSELIDGPTLVSAYDLHYGHIAPPFEFASTIFLDSGGYEASKDTELSDFGAIEHKPKVWTQEMHEEELSKWAATVPSVFISYDHPKHRLPIEGQIARANAMAPGRSNFVREILIKPEKKTHTLLNVKSIVNNIHALGTFGVIGITEKEIGNSILDRMKNIALIRKELTKASFDTPIHVFGSLDTISTPLYFLAGADIFDGLTWLRFAFMEGKTVYKHNFGALQLGVSTKAHLVDARCWHANYYYMTDMELELKRFLTDHDFSTFKYNGSLFRDAVQNTLEAVGD